MALYFNYHFLYISGSLMLKGDCRGGFYSHDWSWDQLGQWERGRPPRLPIISISHQLQRSAGGGNDDAAGTTDQPTPPHGMGRLMELLQS